jgi:hypothetical protein
MTLVFNLLIKIFNLGYKFWIVSIRALICHLNIPCNKTLKIFDLVTLTLVFDLRIENFNFGSNFCIVSTKALIFHMSIPCDIFWPWFWPTYWKL